jgi:sulfate transport system permease protein
VDALIDLPFAMPTAVSGIALCAIFAPNGWIGQWVAPLGIELAYNPIGVVIALTFIGLPFVVRTLQPVLREARASRGGGREPGCQPLADLHPGTVADPGTCAAHRFCPGLCAGVGEYGSVIFIAGNLPWCPRLPPDDHEPPGGV